MTEEKKKTGRKPLYREEYADQVIKLAKLGATLDEIADFFDVSKRTVERWRLKHKKFCRSLKLGRKAADERVKRALYERAIGYKSFEDKVLQHNGEHTETVRIEKHYPPSETAGIFWLTNRQSSQWKRNVPEGQGETPKPLQINIGVQQAADPDKEELKQQLQDDISGKSTTS